MFESEQIFLQCPCYKRVSASIEIEGITNMIAKETKGFSPMYSLWFGKSVVLLIAIRQCRVPVPCSIVGESVANVRIRTKTGWEADIRKELILAVEEDVVGLPSRLN